MQPLFLNVLALAVLVTQSSCITTAPMASHAGRFGYDNTVSAACRQNSANCVVAAGKDVETVRQVGTAVASSAATLQVLFEQAKDSIEVNLETGEKKLVSAAEEKALVNSGNAGELAGTLKPDVVIHEGDPLNAQAAYDFKFPCVNTDRAPDWGRYPRGHPFENETQKSVYQKYIAPFVARILPRLGIVP